MASYGAPYKLLMFSVMRYREPVLNAIQQRGGFCMLRQHEHLKELCAKRYECYLNYSQFHSIHNKA